ncbi:hypothetical protein [uncultured Litoreibacter sp.]|uniref:hypothetical protein n=1 Tax=uncultured Litoreibacter sp. TaxID=1392394 RepID=UPI002634FDA0|nr:hypothetical protein [uncultured Litoreibacter sp.]
MSERTTVETVLRHARGIVNLLTVPLDKTPEQHKQLIHSLAGPISAHALVSRNKKRIDSPSDLILSNLANDGFFFNSVLVIFDLIAAYEQRLEELEDQEKQFWNISHRAPNYYARTIALRFAKHFGRKKNVRPTFGTSSDGNHPSTEYGRALERVFEILEIRADVRKSAEWAISQLDEENWDPSHNPKRILLGNGEGTPSRIEGMKRITEALLEQKKVR